MPERAPPSEFFAQLDCILPAAGDPIIIKTSAKVVSRKECNQIAKRDDTVVGVGLKAGPVPHVLLRPEEVHGASGIGYVLEPLAEGYCYISYQSLRFGSQHLSVPHLHGKRLSAVQAGGVDANLFPREEPADRQRFKASLTVPFLPAVDRNVVLGRQMVKGGKRGDVVRPRKEPAGDPGIEEIVQRLSPLLYGEAELGGDLGVKGRLPGFYKVFHNDLEGLV